MSIAYIFTVKVNDGAMDDFSALASKMVEATKAEDGCEAYEWFAADDGTTVHIYERFADDDALVTHFGNFQAFQGDFFGVCKPAGMTVYGAPSGKAKEILDGMSARMMSPIDGFARLG